MNFPTSTIYSSICQAITDASGTITTYCNNTLENHTTIYLEILFVGLGIYLSYKYFTK